MKKLYFLLITLLIATLSFGQTVFINEIHYDDASGDSGEGVEIAGPAGTDLTGYTLTPYNGNGGASYTPVVALSGTIPDEGSGYGALWFAIAGLQNGAPDGIALDNGGSLIQFLSYEGSFVGVGGVADGITSTDIGVSEGGTVEGSSLQLNGTGLVYTDFVWATETTASPGLINTGQTFGTPVPTLYLVGLPPTGSTIDIGPEDLAGELEFATTNFTVGVDGYIAWAIYDKTGGINTLYDSGDIYDISSPTTFTPLLPNKNYQLESVLKDNSDQQLLNPEAYYFLNANTHGYIDVVNLAALRAGTIDPNTYYHVTGEVIVSFVTGSTRNQIYIQDDSAAILIDDPDGIITTTYLENEGITGLKGQLSSFGNLLQIVPTTDPGAATSSGNPITSTVVTISDLITNMDAYESEAITIYDVTFTDPSDGTFLYPKSYDITDQSGGPIAFRTNYPNAPMTGVNIPVTTATINGIAGEYFGAIQVYPYASNSVLSIKNNQIEGFAMYPNPTSLGYININSKSQTTMKVGVYDVLGKQVINQTVNNNRLDVSNLTSGIYIMKISQDDATTTKKLIIK